MYSLRNIEKTDKVSDKFWIAISSYFNLMVEEGYFKSCIEGWGNNYSLNDGLINLKIAKIIGIKPFPLGEKLKDDDIFDLIEAIFAIMEIPYNEAKGKEISKYKYDFTIEINRMFENFKMNYEIFKGKIKPIHSKVLNELFLDELNCQDKEVHNFLDIALKKFRSKDISEQKIGLNKLVDAFERIKTLKNPENKKDSAKKTAKEVECQGIFFENDMVKMNEISNNHFMIRHTEIDKTTIESPIVIEYLFYLYYNCIRAILLSKQN